MGKKKKTKNDRHGGPDHLVGGPGAGATGRSRPFPVWPLIAVMLLPWFLYLATLDAGFIWDDHNLVEGGPVRHTAGDFFKLWVSDFWQTDRVTNKSEYYRPLTTTTFFLDSMLYGKSPRGYHLTNLVLYSIACGLAFLLYRRLFPDGRLALLLGLAFAALPAHTENVAWVSGRTDVVCAALMFAALIFYLKSEETCGELDSNNCRGAIYRAPSNKGQVHHETGAMNCAPTDASTGNAANTGRTRNTALAVGLFFLSLFGKEMSVTLVAVVFLHQWFFHGLNRQALLRTLPFAVAGLVFVLIHTAAVPPGMSENIYRTPLAYAGNALRNFSLSTWYSLWPGGFEYLVTATREQADRTFRIPTGIGFLVVMLPLLLGLAGFALAFFKKRKLIALALGSGLVAIAPTSGVIPIGVVFAIRFLLIPSFFFLLALGALLQTIPEDREWLKKWPVRPVTLILALVIAAYSVITLIRVPAWHDDAKLMASVLAKEPDSALGHFIMGNALAGEGKNDEAIPHFERAIALRPMYPEAEFNLGVLKERKGHLREAEKWYRSCLVHKPDFRPARMALARLLQGTGRK